MAVSFKIELASQKMYELTTMELAILVHVGPSWVKKLVDEYTNCHEHSVQGWDGELLLHAILERGDNDPFESKEEFLSRTLEMCSDLDLTLSFNNFQENDPNGFNLFCEKLAEFNNKDASHDG